MKTPIYSCSCWIISFLFFTHTLNAQSWQQAKRYSATANGLNTLNNTAVTIAPDSSIYLVGSISGTVEIDDLIIEAPVSGVGLSQGFLAKLNAQMQAMWVVTFPEAVADVATDAVGNIFIAGSAQNDSLTFLAKYNPDGVLLHTFYSEGGISYAKVVRVDAAGNCYLAGWMNAPASFAGIAPEPEGGRESFLIRLNADLTTVDWAVLTGASNKLDEVHDIVLDEEGYVYTSGNYRQTYNIFCLCWSGSFFVEKRNQQNGNLSWTKILSGGSGTSTHLYLAADPDHQVIHAAASFKNTTDFGNGISLSTNSGNDDYHLFSARIDPSSGNVLSAIELTQTGDSYLQNMVGFEQNLHLYGYFVGTLTLGTTSFIPVSRDAFYLQVDPLDHQLLHAETFSGSALDTGMDIDAGPALVVSGGSTSDLLTIGAFELSGTINSIFVATTHAAVEDCAGGFLVATANTPICQGATLQLNASGGSTYVWNGPDGFISEEPSPSLEGVTTDNNGTYTLIATNETGCTDTVILVIQVEDPLVPTIQSNSPLCPGEALMLAASGGISYLWEGPNGFGSNLANPVIPTEAVAEGIYSVRVTGANGCVAFANIGVSINPPLEVSLSGIGPACNGSEDGTIMTLVVGGTPPYTYTWEDGQTTQTAIGLNAGEHTLTITDNQGCTARDTILLTAEHPFNIMISQLHPVTCHGENNGMVEATPIGGMGPYSYLWETGDTLNQLDHLSAGTYFVTITDINGCTVSGGAILPDPPALQVEITTESDDCGEPSNGSAQVMVNGGTPPYNIHWSNGQSGSVINGLMAGNYSVSIVDGNGCDLTETVVIDLQSFEPNLGIIQEGNLLTVNEEVGSYQWFDCTTGIELLGETGQSFLAMESGNYGVMVSNGACSDTSGCVIITVVSANEPDMSIAKADVFPNPNQGQFTLFLPFDAEVSCYNAAGIFLKRTFYTGGTHMMDESNFPAGIYLFQIRSKDTWQNLRWVRQ